MGGASRVLCVGRLHLTPGYEVIGTEFVVHRRIAAISYSNGSEPVDVTFKNRSVIVKKQVTATIIDIPQQPVLTPNARTRKAAILSFARIERGRRTNNIRGMSNTQSDSFTRAEKNRRSEEMLVARWYDHQVDSLSFVDANGCGVDFDH